MILSPLIEDMMLFPPDPMEKLDVDCWYPLHRDPSDELKEPLCMPTEDPLPVLTVVGAMLLHALAAIMEVSAEDVTIKFDIPGVGIIVLIADEELTTCGNCWL